jgi:TolB-like protein
VADFIERLKQRKIVQWALAYIAASFALIQVIDIVAQRFGWPEQTIRIVILAAAIGFFIVLVLAWYHGERGAQRATSTELLILALLLAIGGGAIWKFAPKSESTTGSSAKSRTTHTPADRKSIAVMPFESLSAEKDNAYFASGMQDMILTKLAGIGDLKVISRTSTEKYKSHPENLAVIGTELGVASILEGTVQKAGNQVLINLQLIDVSNDSHLWAQDYTRTLENIFGVEGEVAEKVAGALSAVLTRDERNTLALKPTQNAEALDAYLRGLSLQQAPMFGKVKPLDEFQKAVTLDPNFTLAWTEVVWERLRAFWFGFDVTASNLDAAKAALDRATTLAADTPQVERARAQYLYFAQRDFASAHALMRQVQRGLPNDARTWFFSATVDRRAGLWEEAAENLRKAQWLAPKDQSIPYELVRTAMARRRFDEATAIIEKIPDNSMKIFVPDFQFFAALNTGGLDASGKLIARLESTDLPIYGLRAWQAYLQRDFKTASSLYADAIVRAAAESQFQSEYVVPYLQTTISWQLQQAFCEKRAGEGNSAGALYSAVQKQAQEAIAKKELNASIEAAWHATLAIANAGLDKRDDAVAEAQRAVELIPESNDRLVGPNWQDYLAQVYAMNGDAAHAVPLIRHLLPTNGSNTTRAMLDIDPVWDAIRDDASFQALLREIPR